MGEERGQENEPTPFIPQYLPSPSPDPCSIAASTWACSELMSFLWMFISHWLPESHEILSLLIISYALHLLSFRRDLGRAEREKSMLSLPTLIKRPSSFVWCNLEVALSLVRNHYGISKEISGICILLYRLIWPKLSLTWCGFATTWYVYLLFIPSWTIQDSQNVRMWHSVCLEGFVLCVFLIFLL